MKRSKYLALLLALLMIGGCGRKAAPESAQPLPLGPTEMEVANHHVVDVTIYLVRDGNWLRVGTVTALDEATIQLKHVALAPGYVRIGLDPLGFRQRYLLEQLYVQPGDVIFLTIERHLPNSTWFVTR
ncbi:MAG TPA: hypothetical protein VFO52_11925 [Longimicrobiales bacterium]|nr:hypothetical protein [Longimicrobiales bacterium]